MTEPRIAETAGATRTPPIGPATLGQLAPGTGRVKSVVVQAQAQETLLRLEYPNGPDVVVAVPGVPHSDRDCQLEDLRPLAVRLRHHRAAVDCSVLGTSRTGPRRIRISVAHALTLCASGVHTVLCTE